MDGRVKKWLTDIKLAGEEINFFVGQQGGTFETYRENLLLKRAVERNLEIIGEAVNRIIKFDPHYEAKIENSRKIVSLRNLIIHTYDSISDETIWSVLLTYLPSLLTNVHNLLHDED
ncbi:MAG: DUF86 domain-containing protein [Cyclobacteriaceae bacterium]|jgi:uncharacterized protein with HEPN domain|nr:DUF86 domain-containing protein [Cyclobacteriaceae bacterium]